MNTRIVWPLNYDINYILFCLCMIVLLVLTLVCVTHNVNGISLLNYVHL